MDLQVIQLTESWDGTVGQKLQIYQQLERYKLEVDQTQQACAFGGELHPAAVCSTEEFSFPPPTAAILTEGDVFLSGGTTLKGFGKAAGIPAATWASGGSINTGRYRVWM